MPSDTTATLLDSLGDTPYVSLATWRRNGKEVRTPVWAARAGDRLYVFTEGTAGKVKRLRNSPKSAVAPCDVRGGLKGDFVPARTVVVDDPAVIARAYDAFRAKYGWQIRVTDFFSRLSGRYAKRAMLEIELVE
jgi:hypothetical protein